MKTNIVQVLTAILVLGASAYAVGQVSSEASCPPACGVALSNPNDPDQPPEVDPITLNALPGSWVSFESAGDFRVRFVSETPFVDRNGNPVRQFTTQSGQRRNLTVRQEGSACTTAPGCKYDVIDLGNPGRPVKDPYIIIRR